MPKIGMLRASSRAEIAGVEDASASLRSRLLNGLQVFTGVLIGVLASEFIGVGTVVLTLFFLAMLFCLTVGWGWYRLVRKPDLEIDSLYRDLRRLEREGSGDPAVMMMRESKLSRLRELQRVEAAAMRERFEATASLPPGSGLAALREAKKLLRTDETPASPNPAALRQG